MTDPPQVGLIRHPLTGHSVRRGGHGRRPPSANSMPATSKCSRGLLQEKAIGASQLQQLPVAAIAADEIDAAGELAAQDRLGSEIVGVAVGVAAGKVIPGVVSGGIEARRFRAAKPAISHCKMSQPLALEAQNMAQWCGRKPGMRASCRSPLPPRGGPGAAAFARRRISSRAGSLAIPWDRRLSAMVATRFRRLGQSRLAHKVPAAGMLPLARCTRHERGTVFARSSRRRGRPPTGCQRAKVDQPK